MNVIRASRFVRHRAAASLVLLVLAGTPGFAARDEWFRGLDLEPGLGEASLVLVARVADVSETKVMMGGKAETALQQFKFAPEVVLKGVFSRDSLSLTSQDLGVQFSTGSRPIERGQTRLLMLGRSNLGYAILNPAAHLEQAVPPLTGPNDDLIETAKILLATNASPDRPRKVALLLAGLRAQRGPAAIPLLRSLERRSLIAAQSTGVTEAVTRHLDDPSPAVREQAAATLASLLQADYLEQPALREGAASALAAALQRPDPDVAARVAAFAALGDAGPRALDSQPVRILLIPGAPATFAEQGARVIALGKLGMTSQQGAVLAALKQAPLDAPPAMQSAAEWAVGKLDLSGGIQQISDRLKSKYDAGFPVATEISSLGELAAAAVPALVETAKLSLDRAERYAFVMACGKVAEHSADGRLVAPLSRMLAPTEPDVRWGAVEALMKIGSDDAAKALQPHLAEETDLAQKLKIAGFLGQHGIGDGYSYAIEHMSEPYLREQAVAALAAIRDPRALPELRKILSTSNDIVWNSAAIRALGRLGAADRAPQFLDIARDARNPLAPSALIALGDLQDSRALPEARAALSSRSADLVTAGARAAGQLAALPGVSANDVRDQLAALLADSGAPLEARAAAFDSLVALNDPRLAGALSQAVRDAGLEETELLNKIEKFLSERKIILDLAR